MVRALAADLRAALEVRTLARVATFMPMKMASREKTAPITKPKAICHFRKIRSSTAIPAIK
jgi:hypothetical protein